MQIDFALQLRIVQIWPFDSPTLLHVKTNLRLGERPSRVEHIDWRAYDQAIMGYAQAQCAVVGLYVRHGEFTEDTWKQMDKAEQRFIAGHLPLSYAAGKISFARPVAGEWDLKTPQEEIDRASIVLTALMKMTRAKKEKVTKQLTEMKREEKETTTKELYTKLIKIMEEDEMSTYTLWYTLMKCEHRVWLEFRDLLS